MPSATAQFPMDDAERIARLTAEREGHVAARAEQLEEIIFGLLDGVVTSLALSVSVAGVLKLSPPQAFLTVVAAAIAGSLSMFVGALLSARSRRNLIRRERAREEREVVEMPDQERQEVHDIYRARGFTEEETEILVRRVTSDPKMWVDMMMRDELGLTSEEDSRTFAHGAIIGASYLLGALLPAMPFLLGASTRTDVFGSIAVGGLVLVSVGMLQARFTGTSRLRGAGEILLIGLATALVVFLITSV